MSGKQKEESFEAAFRKLGEIVDKLEKGEETLDSSMKLFEEGMALIKQCSEQLDRAESQLKRLVKDDKDQFFTESLE